MPRPLQIVIDVPTRELEVLHLFRDDQDLNQLQFAYLKRFLCDVADAADKRERYCVGCGCSSRRACKGGCSWMVRHEATPTGVCSNCFATPVPPKPKRKARR